ncbi:MAG: hypothetical protein WHX93_12040 [bacterium]
MNSIQGALDFIAFHHRATCLRQNDPGQVLVENQQGTRLPQGKKGIMERLSGQSLDNQPTMCMINLDYFL